MNKKSEKNKSNVLVSDERVCGECGGKKITTTWQSYNFPYGVGTDAIELSCKVPARNCDECGFTFLDGEAEDFCHAAICRHLGVMTPESIRALRKLYRLTQAQFCEISKLGDATLSRWERGIIVQNSAYDNYLYLLGFRENMDRLRTRDRIEEATGLMPKETDVRRFRAIELNEELWKRQEAFELQPCLMVGE